MLNFKFRNEILIGLACFVFGYTINPSQSIDVIGYLIAILFLIAFSFVLIIVCGRIITISDNQELIVARINKKPKVVTGTRSTDLEEFNNEDLPCFLRKQAD